MSAEIPPMRRVIPPPTVSSRRDERYDSDGNVRDVGVVIVAGGTGSRTGSNELKQFRWAAGKPVLLHSVQSFMARSDVGIVVVVLPKAYAADPPPWLFQCDVDRLLITVGGDERSDSVISGLEDLPPEIDIVVVHDAARPLVTDATIDRVIVEARRGHGAVAAIPIVDTVKEIDSSGRIVRTVSRRGLWRAQTPQAFPREQIERAYLQAKNDGISGTDDSELAERIGLEVIVVQGSERGFKITEASDFARADALQMLED